MVENGEPCRFASCMQLGGRGLFIRFDRVQVIDSVQALCLGEQLLNGRAMPSVSPRGVTLAHGLQLGGDLLQRPIG